MQKHTSMNPKEGAGRLPFDLVLKIVFLTGWLEDKAPLDAGTEGTRKDGGETLPMGAGAGTAGRETLAGLTGSLLPLGLLIFLGASLTLLSSSSLFLLFSWAALVMLLVVIVLRGLAKLWASLRQLAMVRLLLKGALLYLTLLTIFWI